MENMVATTHGLKSPVPSYYKTLPSIVAQVMCDMIWESTNQERFLRKRRMSHQKSTRRVNHRRSMRRTSQQSCREKRRRRIKQTASCPSIREKNRSRLSLARDLIVLLWAARVVSPSTMGLLDMLTLYILMLPYAPRRHVDCCFTRNKKEKLTWRILVIAGHNPLLFSYSFLVCVRVSVKFENGLKMKVFEYPRRNITLLVALVPVFFDLSMIHKVVTQVETTPIDGQKRGTFGLRKKHFGIKYYMEDGGPAPEAITDKIYENMETLKEYYIAEDLPDVDICSVGVTSFGVPEGQFDVDVFDSASDYVKSTKSIFDFQSIQKLRKSSKFMFCYDALHGVAGAYAKCIFVDELGAQESSLINCKPKEDFEGGHPDPNLIYAEELVACMGLDKSKPQNDPPEFGADADCNMSLGKRFFGTTSDLVAIIAANAVETISYFAGGLKGVARSMPTSASVDVVAKHLNLESSEVHTGWTSFGNLMDPGVCSVCGEDSFGTEKVNFINICSSRPLILGHI